MERLKEIIAQRSAPGVLILDLEDRLLYSNREALEMLEALQGGDGAQQVPAEVYQVCRDFRSAVAGGGPALGLIPIPGGDSAAGQAHYSLRALPLGNHGE